MIHSQENRLTMLEAVNTFLSENQAVISDVAELVQNQNALIEKKNLIHAKEDQRMNASKGKTKTKEATRKAVTSFAITIAGALFSFAKKSDNISLMAKSNFTTARLNKIRDSELPITLNSLRDLTQANIDSLEQFGVTPEMLTALEVKITNYVKALGEKESAVATRSSASKALSVLFKEADSILKTIDKLAVRFRETNLQFYNGYKSARIVRITGVRHKTIPVQPQETPVNLNSALPPDTQKKVTQEKPTDNSTSAGTNVPPEK